MDPQVVETLFWVVVGAALSWIGMLAVAWFYSRR